MNGEMIKQGKKISFHMWTSFNKKIMNDQKMNGKT